MTIELLFAGLPVRQFQHALDWYGRFFGRAADVVVTDQEDMWRVADSAWIYVIENVGDAGRKATVFDPERNSIALIQIAR